MSLRAASLVVLCLALGVGVLPAQGDRVASEVDKLLKEAPTVLPE